jgi:glycosyltransferase involved in cell wall biosynthesis
MDEGLSVAVISGPVGKCPEDIAYSFVFDEVYRLARKGLDMHVVRSKIERESTSYGIHFHGIERKIDLQALNMIVRNFTRYPPISLLRKPTTLYWENLYALNVSKVIEKNDIDLIHAHFAYPEGLAGSLAKRRTSKPLVVTVHGYDILVEKSVKYGVRLSKKMDAVVREVLNNADAIVAASKVTLDEVRKIVRQTDKVYLIPNGVDVQRFNPKINVSSVKKTLGTENCFIIFTLRHHEPRYGLEYLIRAIPIVLKQRNDVVFVIGGEGSLQQYHEQLVIKLGAGKNVRFIGKISPSEVPLYYAMSNMVVVPSLQEAFGLVVAEAMACGKPVIGTRVGGIPDQIIDRYNGFLIPPRSPIQIAEKILWLIEHPDEAKQMGMNGRKIVEEKFNIQKRAERIISLYEGLVARHS